MIKKDQEMSVSSFLNTRYKDYSKYVLYSRAIPSVIDGFKPSQRKIIYTAMKVCKDNKIKCASLAGDVISKANYHHGNASLEDAINGIVQDFKNNIPWMEGHGSFGSRLVTEASAARYTHTRLSKVFYKYFNDFDVCDIAEDPEDPEPLFYLPKIPTVLLNGVKGIAIGFSTTIRPRKPEHLIEAVRKVIHGESLDNFELPPYYEGYKGEIKKNVDGVYSAYGVFKIGKRNLITVTEVPLGYDRVKFVSHLNTLQDNGIIKSYKDECSKVGFSFDIRPNFDPNTISYDEVCDKLGMIEALKENITLIDANGNVKVYDDPKEIIVEFCKYRVKKYKERYTLWAERDTEKKKYVDIKISFVRAVLVGKIDLKSMKRKQIRELLEAKIDDPDIIEGLLRMPMYSMCEDGLNDLIETSNKLKDNIATWKSINPLAQYRSEIEEL